MVRVAGALLAGLILGVPASELMLSQWPSAKAASARKLANRTSSWTWVSLSESHGRGGTPAAGTRRSACATPAVTPLSSPATGRAGSPHNPRR